MSLSQRLQALGSRLGLVRLEPVQPAAGPAKISTRSVPLSELKRELSKTQLTALAADEAWLEVPHGRIFAAARLAEPAHGWTAEKVAERLVQADLAALPPPQAQVALLNELARAGARTEDLVRDAMDRDQALDAFAAQVQQRLAATRNARRRRLAEIADALARLDEERRQIESAEARDQAAWEAWWARKHEREQRLADGLAPLIAAPPISVDRQVPPLD